jgi:hypothetical protein
MLRTIFCNPRAPENGVRVVAASGGNRTENFQPT